MKEKVLFIVYRAEWWGCFESLCAQECAREDTAVYIMPVPRYERNLQTMEIDFKREHFSPEMPRESLPEGAQLADYRNFPLDQMLERIYIHNPYDSSYLLDSVPADFYSSNLKRSARRLIYVPHLLYLGGIPEEYAASPVYDYVDAIYLPTKEAGFSLPVEYDGKVEIVPSGIPGYLERIGERTSRREREEQPGHGEKPGQAAHREKPARTAQEGKKLLFCLSYMNLYYGTEKILQKVKDVFEYFRYHNNIQLIFRPDEDIRGKLPWLQESVRKKYQELETYFKMNRIGIWDESPDLYRAAAEADGIISAGHMMDVLFGVQGKYMLHLDNTLRPVPTQEDLCIPSLWAMTAVEKQDGVELWFVPEGTRLICRMMLPGEMFLDGTASKGPAEKNGKGAVLPETRLTEENGKRAVGKSGKRAAKKTGKKCNTRQKIRPEVEIIAKVPDDFNGWLRYNNITKAGDCLYLSPFSTGGIWKYEIDTGIFRETYLPGAGDSSISLTFPYGKYLYMIPRMYPGIVKYDMETDEAEILDGWVEEMDSRTAQEHRKEPYFIWAVKQEGNMLYMASSKCDIWMEFDMDRDTWQMKSMGLPGMRWVDMVKYGDYVWLFPYGGDEVVCWNRSTCESCVVYSAPTEECVNIPYAFGLDLGDDIAAFPCYRENPLLIPHSTAGGGMNESKFSEWVKAGSNVTKISAMVQSGRTLADISKKALNVAGESDSTAAVEVPGRIPGRQKDFQSEYQRQLKTTYQFLQELDTGQILVYEHYDGAFLLLNRKLQIQQKIFCRLPLEAAWEQTDNLWRDAHCRSRFSGGLGECWTFPAMIGYFERHGCEDGGEIKEYYQNLLAGRKEGLST